MDLNIIQHFISVQGEGPFSGDRTLFLRMSGCTVGCSWCDEKRSWKRQESILNSDELIKMIHNLKPERVSITGGEPFEDEDGLMDILNTLLGIQDNVSVETSGYFAIQRLFHAPVAIVISPKPFQLQRKFGCITPTGLMRMDNCHLKLVIGDIKDARIYYEGLFQEHLPANPFYFQPMYDNKKQFNVDKFREGYDYLWDNGIMGRVSLQIHKHLGLQ